MIRDKQKRLEILKNIDHYVDNYCDPCEVVGSKMNKENYCRGCWVYDELRRQGVELEGGEEEVKKRERHKGVRGPRSANDHIKRKDVVKDLMNGLTYADIGKKHGKSSASIKAYASRTLGINTKEIVRKRNIKNLENIEKKIENGMTKNQIAAEKGISLSTLHQQIDRGRKYRDQR